MLKNQMTGVNIKKVLKSCTAKIGPIEISQKLLQYKKFTLNKQK